MLGSTRWVEERLARPPVEGRRVPLRRLLRPRVGLHGRRLAGPRGLPRRRPRGRAGPRDGPAAPLRARDAPAPRLQRRHGAVRRDGRRAGRAGGLRAAHVRDVPHGLRRPAARAPASRPRLGPLGVRSRASSPCGLRFSRTRRFPSWSFTEISDFLRKEIEGLPAGAAEPFPRRRELLCGGRRAFARRLLPGTTSGPRSAARARTKSSRSSSARWPRSATFPGARDFARSSLLLGPSAETGCGTETLPGLRRALHGDGSPALEAERLLRALAASEAKLREATRIARS